MPTRDNPPGIGTEAAIIDWNILDALQSLRKPDGTDFKRHLMNVYLDSSSRLMEGIRAAFANRDGESLVKAAHTLKSSSLSVGATGLGELCMELERIGKSGEIGGSSDLLDRVSRQYEAVENEFREAIGRNGA